MLTTHRLLLNNSQVLPRLLNTRSKTGFACPRHKQGKVQIPLELTVLEQEQMQCPWELHPLCKWTPQACAFCCLPLTPLSSGHVPQDHEHPLALKPGGYPPKDRDHEAREVLDKQQYNEAGMPLSSPQSALAGCGILWRHVESPHLWTYSGQHTRALLAGVEVV